jgi:hypothetical protein
MIKDATPMRGAPLRETAFWRLHPSLQVTLEAKPAASAETGPREVGVFFGHPH